MLKDGWAKIHSQHYKASIIGILMMLALKNINYKASIIGILIILKGNIAKKPIAVMGM